MRNRWFVYVVALAAVAIVAAWWMMRDAIHQAVEPPFSQDELAQAIVLSVRSGQAAQFAATLFDLADLNEYVVAASDSADSSDIEAIEKFAESQRADWPLYEQQMRQQFENAVAALRDYGAENPVYDGFSVDYKRFDAATGRIIFDRFDIHILDGENHYTIEAEMLRQTADGWKLSGNILRLYPDIR